MLEHQVKNIVSKALFDDVLKHENGIPVESDKDNKIQLNTYQLENYAQSVADEVISELSAAGALKIENDQ